jgi:hypothetical protein
MGIFISRYLPSLGNFILLLGSGSNTNPYPVPISNIFLTILTISATNIPPLCRYCMLSTYQYQLCTLPVSYIFLRPQSDHYGNNHSVTYRYI